MEIKASVNNLRMSARKIRLVIDVVRGLNTAKALEQLKFINKLATRPVAKLVNSAIANAVNNFELDKDNLYIKEVKADEGKTAYRWMPKAHGRATPIRKKTCHVSLVLAEIKDSGKKEAKKQKIEAPVKLGEKPKEDKGVEVKDKKEKSGEKPKDANIEKDKEIVDPRMEGRHGHAKIEGGSNKGFVNKMFRRKSG
jgi:large subunit ribosomal protein L22